ncbi:MAG: signal peptidase I [Treponema sp.]|nr:signal peptidase I [Treponema sp.]
MKTFQVTQQDENNHDEDSLSRLHKRSEKMLKLIFLALFCAFFLKFFVIDYLKIAGKSMEPVIKDRQIVFINRLAYGLSKPFTDTYFFQWKKPSRNDIVLFLHDNKIVVKRCVLTGGDYLEILSDSEYDNNYYLLIDEKHIPVNQRQYNWLKDITKVPDNFIFVLGDNFNNSVDSRDYGFVSCRNITGKVIGKD